MSADRQAARGEGKSELKLKIALTSLMRCGIMKIMKVTTITKPNVKKAQRHLAKLRELVSKRKHPFSNMTEEEIINTLRKTREEIWGKKLAARS